jgi:hypothetical protein
VSIFEEIRTACAVVSERARSVRILDHGLCKLADDLSGSAADASPADPAHRPRRSAEETIAFVVTLDAVNFGSGWFPHLVKRPGCSGYFTISTALSEHFDEHGPIPAAALRSMTAERCAALFGQPMAAPIDVLMEHFARSWRDLGEHLVIRHAGEFVRLIDAAGHRAGGLVGQLAEMPLYRDVSHYGDVEVPFFKRAQITCADLAGAFAGSGPGCVEDLHQLTIFADNLVPHVLRVEGVLEYAPALLARIDAEQLIPAGSPEEIEIRAVALHAVEQMVGLLGREGVETTAQRLDQLLWNRGQSPAIKARPRHRTRSIYY